MWLAIVHFLSQETKTQYLLNIEVCFNKQLEIIDCDNSGRICSDTEPIAYPAFPRSAHAKNDILLSVIN